MGAVAAAGGVVAVRPFAGDDDRAVAVAVAADAESLAGKSLEAGPEEVLGMTAAEVEPAK